MKATEDAIRRFRRMACERGMTLGALFEQAVDSLEEAAPGRASVAPAVGPSSRPFRYRFGSSNCGLF